MYNLRKSRNQAGFSFVEVLLVLVIIGAVVAVGFYVANRQDETVDSNTTNTTQESDDINNAQDLQEAEEALNQEDLDALDDSELQEAEEDLL